VSEENAKPLTPSQLRYHEELKHEEALRTDARMREAIKTLKDRTTDWARAVQPEAVGDILNEMQADKPELSTTPAIPSWFRELAKQHDTVEVAPSASVDNRQIEAAVQVAVDDHLTPARLPRLRGPAGRAELKRDIEASKKVVQSLVDRLNEPVKPDEKYISFDAMPPPLKRVIEAYIALDAAQKELDKALKGMQQLVPPQAV
jgi:hypothetical protein